MAALAAVVVDRGELCTDRERPTWPPGGGQPGSRDVGIFLLGLIRWPTSNAGSKRDERGRQDPIDAGSIVRSLNGGRAAGSLIRRAASAYSAPASVKASIERVSGSTIQ